MNSIPEMGFSAAHKPVYIPTLIAEKSHMHEIVQISCFRMTCLLNVLYGEFYTNVNVI
jgi:hypothetical protein